MTADYERWQQLDFVVGIRIELSNNHTLNDKKFRDICDELSEPLDGRSVNRVTDVPQEFTDWVRDNSERIEHAKSLPYFIKDNKDIVDGILNPKQKALTTLEKAKLRHDARTPEQIEAIKNRWAERNASRSKLDDIITKVENFGVEYNPVKEYTKQPTIDEIILNLGGGDMTDGSCSSLALAYAGNRSGFFVLDFRDGRSQMYFSRVLNINEIAKKVGGKVVKNTNDFKSAKELLETVEEGKEYYFTCGEHAAIVRKSNGRFEYLELQSKFNNGFKRLNDGELQYRFGAKKTRTLFRQKVEAERCIIDIDWLKNDTGFRKLLGYINTAKDKQVKGTAGTIK